MKFRLSKELKGELAEIYKDYINRHEKDEDKILVPCEDESYEVTLSSCIDICKNMIRIPTEYYCGAKVYPRSLDLISDYTYYEKKCVYEILKEYDTDLTKEISKYLKSELKYD